VKSLRCWSSLLFLALGALASTVAAKPTAALKNPSEVRYTTQREAMAAASLYAQICGGSLIITSGTSSMEPLIHGKVYAVITKRSFGSIAKSDILVYQGRPNAAADDIETMLHRAVLEDKDGWIMSGDNNRWSESWDRVTSDNYVGTVVALFAFPQA
jgi:hypothetical protein